jgi:hypothetical protein
MGLDKPEAMPPLAEAREYANARLSRESEAFERDVVHAATAVELAERLEKKLDRLTDQLSKLEGKIESTLEKRLEKFAQDMQRVADRSKDGAGQERAEMGGIQKAAGSGSWGCSCSVQ